MTEQCCQICGETKDMSEFSFRHKKCKPCRAEECRNTYARLKSEDYFSCKCMISKKRARRRDIPFDLTPEYLESIWTDTCPVLGIPMTKGDRNDESSSELDRIIPELGYIPGNVVFLTRRANRIKDNATLDEIESLFHWMKENCER